MNKRFSLFVLMILLAAMLSAASIISSPAATVNLIRNTAITMQDLDEEMARYEALGIQGVNKTDVLQTLINNEVFLQGAERDGISISDRQIDSLYAQAKANIEAQAGMAISDAEFEAEVIRQFGTVEAYRESLKSSVSSSRRTSSLLISISLRQTMKLTIMRQRLFLRMYLRESTPEQLHSRRLLSITVRIQALISAVAISAGLLQITPSHARDGEMHSAMQSFRWSQARSQVFLSQTPVTIS